MFILIYYRFIENLLIHRAIIDLLNIYQSVEYLLIY